MADTIARYRMVLPWVTTYSQYHTVPSYYRKNVNGSIVAMIYPNNEIWQYLVYHLPGSEDSGYSENIDSVRKAKFAADKKLREFGFLLTKVKHRAFL